jgi:NAD(P)-dependent dehydrogenase (short-subunit alcohol dehydrogenase family)
MNTEELYATLRPCYSELQGKVAIVTGSSRGIGKGIALRLAREGMKVVVNGRDPAPVHEFTEELTALGASALAVPANIGSDADADRLFAETLAAWGRIDLLVNNAVFMVFKESLNVTEELLDESWRVNVRGAFLLSQRAAQEMVEHEGGSIVNISSVGGLRAHWRGSPYDMTKGALDAMTRTMSLDLASHGIRVNAIAPGAILTERRGPSMDPYKQAVSHRIPMQRLGMPLEIASVVAFLASDEASYLTGQVLYVDGGITTQLTPPDSPI